MKIILVIFLVIGFSISSFGQKKLDDLKPPHKSALNGFLSKNLDYKFLSEAKIAADYLKTMRGDFGKSFAPYYRVGDFNNDKVIDFAMILAKKGTPIDQGKEMSEEHRYRQKLAIIIFNGQKAGGFRKAFIRDIDAPYVCFLNQTQEKNKKLYFGIYETDESYLLVQNARGYVMK